MTHFTIPGFFGLGVLAALLGFSAIADIEERVWPEKAAVHYDLTVEH